ncbi:MAG: GLPGLI family protein [Saprospiraceae bacterium]|nr:GLPGLI family protein [Saprospiraceae bacterium]
MKSIFTLLICFLSLQFIFGQSGVIKYTENRQMKIELPDGQEHLADLLPSFNSSVKQLSFTASESSFIDVSEDQKHSMENETSEGTMKIEIKRSASEGNYYKNLDDNMSIEKKDLMGKYFIVEEEIESPKWKMLNEQKQILDYMCMKASMETEDGMTTAWFTPQIPISNGPDKWGGLPGMILELEVHDGEITYTASSIEMKEEVMVNKPKDGKKVSPEEYEKIREKKMKEMEEMYGTKSKNGGVFIIKG